MIYVVFYVYGGYFVTGFPVIMLTVCVPAVPPKGIVPSHMLGHGPDNSINIAKRSVVDPVIFPVAAIYLCVFFFNKYKEKDKKYYKLNALS